VRDLYHPNRAAIELTAVMHALSDPTRLSIVRGLADGEERACGTFMVDVGKSTLSQHFKVLRDAGLVTTRIEGTTRMQTLRREDLDARFPGLLDAILGPVPAESGSAGGSAAPATTLAPAEALAGRLR
jgi:DNA-binding transcriptional ArsR family regulator